MDGGVSDARRECFTLFDLRSLDQPNTACLVLLPDLHTYCPVNTVRRSNANCTPILPLCTFPKLLPSSNRIKAFGALSNPSTICSQYFIFPSASLAGHIFGKYREAITNSYALHTELLIRYQISVTPRLSRRSKVCFALVPGEMPCSQRR